jgi:hypothetical protein
MIFFEIVCIVSGSTVLRVLGIKVFGRWIYSAVHGLVWVKWSIGSYLLGQYSPDYEGQYSPAMINPLVGGLVVQCICTLLLSC